jgi:hypothetical protein
MEKKIIYKMISNKIIAIKRMRTKFEYKKIKGDEIEKKIYNFIDYSK